jgi:photosystem II stability/assembly factor-like uncharacterized protein
MPRIINTFLIAIIFLSPSGIFAQGYWQKLNSPTTKLLKNLFFTDNLNGWACGNQGIIIHTTDGGNTWEIQNSNVESFIVDIFFLNANRGWALTQRNSPPFGTTILKTSDGGSMWSNIDYFEDHIFMNTVFFFDTLNGFLGGSYIARTTDGGTSWIKANTDSNIYSTLPVYNFDFTNHQIGYACGGTIDFAGVIWKTNDSGKNWVSNAVSADQVFDMTTLDSSNLLALSGDPEGLYGIVAINSSDAGNHWNSEKLQIYGLSFSLEFRTSIEGWSASGKKFIYTSDKGNTWIEKETPDSSIIYDLQFVNSQTGYAVGDKGIILKFVPPPLNVEDEPSADDDFQLFQNYPNPFNPSTKIRYKIPTSPLAEVRIKGEFITLKVYDVLGKEAATLVDEYKSSGVYDVEFNSTDLPSGVYFYTLKAGSYHQTRKMLILK